MRISTNVLHVHLILPAKTFCRDIVQKYPAKASYRNLTKGNKASCKDIFQRHKRKASNKDILQKAIRHLAKTSYIDFLQKHISYTSPANLSHKKSCKRQ